MNHEDLHFDFFLSKCSLSTVPSCHFTFRSFFGFLNFKTTFRLSPCNESKQPTQNNPCLNTRYLTLDHSLTPCRLQIQISTLSPPSFPHTHTHKAVVDFCFAQPCHPQIPLKPFKKQRTNGDICKCSGARLPFSLTNQTPVPVVNLLEIGHCFFEGSRLKPTDYDIQHSP